MLQEFYVTITQKVARPPDRETAAQILADLATWRVHAPGTEDVLAAVDIQRRYGIAFWDAMIIRGAMQLGCETVWSEDLNPGQVYEGTTIANPFVT